METYELVASETTCTQSTQLTQFAHTHEENDASAALISDLPNVNLGDLHPTFAAQLRLAGDSARCILQ